MNTQCFTETHICPQIEPKFTDGVSDTGHMLKFDVLELGFVLRRDHEEWRREVERFERQGDRRNRLRSPYARSDVEHLTRLLTLLRSVRNSTVSKPNRRRSKAPIPS